MLTCKAWMQALQTLRNADDNGCMSDVDYTQPPWGIYGRDLVLGVISGGSKAILQGLNQFNVNGLERFQNAVLNRPQGTALFTVSNHTRYIPG